MADILYLVERLEQVLAQGWRVPLTTNAVIDEDAFIDIIEQMHIAIPNEIRQAQQIVQQKERLLAQAREEAERLLAQARAEAERLVDDTDLVERARSRSAEIIEVAQGEAQEIRAGADAYSEEVLTRIRDELQVYLRQVDNGLKRLRTVEPPPAAPLELEELDEAEEEEENPTAASS